MTQRIRKAVCLPQEMDAYKSGGAMPAQAVEYDEDDDDEDEDDDE